MKLIIQLPSREEQLGFNRKRYAELLADPFVASLPHRVETNHEGIMLMSPPPNFIHSQRCQTINELLNRLLVAGKAYTAIPINTLDGVRAADVGWLSSERQLQAAQGAVLEMAPEICVEVRSSSNSDAEMTYKKTLYFEAGADEVWICDEGVMHFYVPGDPMQARQTSLRCPDFPQKIEIK